MSIFADGETVGSVVAFTPPAIKDAEVEAPVAAGFHAAGAGSFERPAGSVEPDIAAGDHLAGDVDVVVLQEDEMALEVAVFAEMDDVLDVAFPVVVARVGFAGKDELNGARLVAREP